MIFYIQKVKTNNILRNKESVDYTLIIVMIY